MNFLIAFVQLGILGPITADFDLKCPSTGQRRLRAQSYCPHEEMYTCLKFIDPDMPDEQKYTETCKGPRKETQGEKTVINNGNFDIFDCSEDRYQPILFSTTKGSNCLLSKSNCNEEGQLIYSNGSTTQDRTCGCNYAEQYVFLSQKINHPCYCIPSVEDCTCYKKACDSGLRLSPDYKCVPANETSERYNCKEIVTLEKDIVVNFTKSGLEEENIQGRSSDPAIIYTVLVFVLFGIIWPVLFWKRIQIYEVPFSSRLQDIVELEDADVPLTCEVAFANDPVKKFKDRVCSAEVDIKGPLEATEVYYLRIIHLLFTLACPVLRMTFDKEVHPEKLSSLLNIHREQLTKQKLDQYERETLFPKEKKDKVTSAAFDIKILITLLNTLAKKKIGNVWPDYFNTSEKANLERIYYCRNSTKQILNGQLSFEDFTKYWDNISQAILRLASPGLHSIEENSKDSERLLMMERIVNLNPVDNLNSVDFQQKTLHEFVQLAGVYSSKIFGEIINEFCTSEHISVEELLDSGKHQLFHQRKKTKSCCRCETYDQWVPFHRCLAEEEWNTIYSKRYRKNLFPYICKCKGDATTCCDRFYLKPGFNLESCDRSLCMCIILYIPALLKFTIKQMFSSGGFHDFLGKHKHRLYHAMSSNRCCVCIQKPNCEIILSEENWKKLYEKISDTSSFCTNSDCFCMYRVHKGIESEMIDANLLSEIISTVGPLSAIKRYEDSVFKHFINGDLDEKYLRDSCNDTKTVFNELLDTISDDEFRKDMKTTIFSINQTVEESKIDDDLQAWASKCLEDGQPLESPGIQRPILIRWKDGFKLFEVQSTAAFNLSGRRKPKNVTKPENYFLRVFQLLLKVAYPAVKVRFDREFPPEELPDILHEWSSGHRDERKSDTKDNKNGTRHHSLFLTQKQRKAIFETECSSENFDIQLMGYLLKEWMKKKDKGDKSISADLQILLAIDDKIMYNCNGQLTQTEFNNYWKEIKEASIRLGDGEKSGKCCFELEKIDNILCL